MAANHYHAIFSMREVHHKNEGLTQKFKTSSSVRAVKTSCLQGKDGDAYFTT